jgi:4-hydroxybenzoate polyprenyltransferase
MHLTVSSPVQSLADIQRIEATPLAEAVPWASTYDLIRASAQAHAEQPALTFLHTGQPGGKSTTWTYRSLLQGIHQTANLLHQLGVGPEDAVGVLLPGGLAYHLALWGGEAAGIVQPLNPLLSDEKLLSLLRASNAKVLIAHGAEDDSQLRAKALRLHQWLKNGLLLVPLLASHQLTDGAAWMSLFWAFVAFSLCASSVYIANDLLDLESDRQHPRKCNRPFASGALPVHKGALLAPILFLLSCGVGVYVGPDFLQWLLIYFVLTCIYSVKLKQLVLVDCMTLAILYTLRIVAGAAAVASAMSFWLLAFSVFLFLSLAFIKRFAELQVQLLQGKHKAHGRGYFTDDAPLIQMLGIASGFMSVLVLALYLNSPDVQLLYAQPEWVWGNVPVMVFWVSWLWLRAHRGEMHDDPLIFAVKDKVSLVSGVLFAGFLLLGSLQP